MRAALVLVVLVLAGCVAPQAEEPGPRPAAPSAVEVVAAAPREPAPQPDPPIAKRPIGVEAELEVSWARPRRPVAMSAVAEGGAEVSWFVGVGGARLETLATGGVVYAGVGIGQRPAAWGEPADPGAAEAGGATAPFALPVAGRYSFASAAHPGAVVNVTVRPEARGRDVAHATLVPEGDRARFSPEEVEVAPGGRIRFWNLLAAADAVVERSYHAPLPGDARPLVPVTVGEYEVLALARDAWDGWGEARLRLLVDLDAPPSTLAVGPFSGRLSVADAPGAPRGNSHPFQAIHPVEGLALRVLVESSVPGAPAAARVAILRGDEEVAAVEASGEAEVAVARLEPGEYRLVVEAGGSVLLTYEASGGGRYRADPPPPR